MVGKEYIMTIWIGGEVGLDGNDFESYRLITNQIEKSFNKYLQEIGYVNKDLDSLDVIAILRDDNYFNEIKKYRSKKRDTDIRLKIDYNEFKNADEKKRKKMIYEGLLKAFDLVEKQKKIKGLDIIKEYINKQIQS